MKGIKEVVKSKSFASLAGNGFGAVLGVLSFALLARFLSKEDFGTWILFLGTYSVFETLRIGMVLNALVRNVASADSIEHENEIIGSSFVITSILTIIYLIVVGIVYFIFLSFNILPNYHYFFIWYVLYALTTIPHNFASWVLNARLNINQMSMVKLFNQLAFIISSWLLLLENNSVHSVFYAYLISHITASVLCISLGWSEIRKIIFYSKEMFMKIFHFGKYSMGTLIGANLIRNSDNYIIGSMLGNTSVAVYSVPTRIIDIIELPIRSFAITTLPEMAKIYSKNDPILLKQEFQKRAGIIFVLLFPLSLICFLFAPEIVHLISGDKYPDSVILLRLFSIYTAIIPLDKFSGIMLDIINKPNKNFQKVIWMLAVNVIGDFIAIYFFHNLESVAIVSTFAFGTGMFYGFFLLKKYIQVSFFETIKTGFLEAKILFKRLTHVQ